MRNLKKNRTLAVKRKVWGSRAFTRVRIKPPALGALKKILKKTTQFYSPLAISVSVESGGWGGGCCRLHCSPHNLSLSIISSLAILTAQKKYNRRETNRNRKPTKKQITTTTKAKKEDPPPDHEAFPSRHPLRHLGGKFLHICAFLWRSLQVWSRLWFQAGLEV